MEKLMLETAVENNVQQRTKRGRTVLPGLLRAFQKAAEESAAKIAETSKQEAEKLGKMAAAVEEAIRQDQGTTDQDDQRVRSIINAATGGGVERMLRHSPVLEQDDNREFLRRKSWRV